MDTERKMNATFILSANTKKRHLSNVLAVVSGQRVFVWICYFFQSFCIYTKTNEDFEPTDVG